MLTIAKVISLIQSYAPVASPEDIAQAVNDYLDDHPEIEVADGSITEEKLASDVLLTLSTLESDVSDVKTAIQGVEEDLGLTSEEIDLGSGNPLTINGEGLDVDLTFTTATEFLKTGKNLFPDSQVSFTRTKTVSLPCKYPAGKYNLSMFLESSDTSYSYSIVYLRSDSAYVTSAQEGGFAHNQRTNKTMNATGWFDRVVFFAATGYADSADKTATYSDIMLVPGESASEYEAYTGSKTSLIGTTASIETTEQLTRIYTNDLSNVSGIAHIGADPVIPKMQTQIEALEKPLKGKKILVFGDSIWGNDRENGVCDFLAEYSGATIFNGAIGGTRITGDRTQYEAPNYIPFDGVTLIHAKLTNTWTDQDAKVDDVVSYVKTDTLPMLKSVDLSEVDIVVLSYGTNDFTGSRTSTSIQSAYNTAISELLTAYPELRILVVTPAWRTFENGTEDADTYENSNNETVKDIADGIVENANNHHISALNMWNELPWRAETATLYMDTDKVHPNTNGNKIYAHIVNGKLRSMY